MAFEGMRIFISRRDFPPQLIDSMQDALRENGAEVCICSNPSCNGQTDFHVLPATEHEKIAELRRQGCNVIGPDCVFRCAKEHRPFPNQGYTCCLAMEGAKVLATGFEKQEKVEIEWLVTAMCGKMEMKALTNATFIIAKDVLAAKYKWSVNNLRRPVLKVDWLLQCWREHRLVPHEPYRLPPFTGLIICATNVPLEERKQIEELCMKNGGIYSADLTRKCTHLIAYFAEGDKFKVARRWGTVKIVNRQWFGQCLAVKACVDEDLFPVHPGEEKLPMNSQQSSGSLPLTSPLESSKSEAILLSVPSTISNTPSCDEVPVMYNASDGIRTDCTLKDDHSIILQQSPEDSLCEEQNMYLSNCRFYFSGFTAAELRKFVNIVRDGGGTRHMEFNDKVSHVIVGKLTESDLKDIRQSAMWRCIHILWPSWLEECSQQKEEVIIDKRHIVPYGNLLKGSNSKDSSRMESVSQQLCGRQQISLSQSLGSECGSGAILMCHNVKPGDVKVPDPEQYPTEGPATKESSKAQVLQGTRKLQNTSALDSAQEVKMAAAGSPGFFPFEEGCHAIDKSMKHSKTICDGSTEGMTAVDENLLRVCGSFGSRIDGCKISKESDIFKGHMFAISESFPMNRRQEIVHWIVQGGGVMDFGSSNDSTWRDTKTRVDFIVIGHGTRLNAAELSRNAKPISSHWIRYCLEEGKMLDPEDHVLYQPLQCQVPFPGFQAFRFCVSQYEDKDRLLLRNLCFVLGAKFTEKLSRKVTHLLCKVKEGQKYEAACKWGIQVTTADWLFACISQDMLASIDNFQPREISAAEKDAGCLGMTQCSTQAAHFNSGDTGSQWDLETQESNENLKKAPCAKSAPFLEPSLVHFSERNKHVRSMSASQAVPGSLDPWDEQTVQWLDGVCGDLKDGNSYPQEDCQTKQMTWDQHNLHAVTGSSSPCMTASIDKGRPSNKHLTSYDKGDVGDVDKRMEADADKENCANWNSSSDVAAAIEGLLAQTTRVSCNDTSKQMEVDQKLSPEHTTIKRNREEDHRFKRPKQLQNGADENLAQAKMVCSNVEDMAGFDESQMDSPVIGYDEDHMGRQLIMERVRTRSLSMIDGNNSLRSGNKAASWKNDGLGRLFKVAEANK